MHFLNYQFINGLFNVMLVIRKNQSGAYAEAEMNK